MKTGSAVQSCMAAAPMASSRSRHSIRSRVSGRNERLVPRRNTSAGMMLGLSAAPAAIWPMLITAQSCAATLRATIEDSADMKLAAAMVGSLPRCGMAPCPPSP